MQITKDENIEKKMPDVGFLKRYSKSGLLELYHPAIRENSELGDNLSYLYENVDILKLYFGKYNSMTFCSQYLDMTRQGEDVFEVEKASIKSMRISTSDYKDDNATRYTTYNYSLSKDTSGKINVHRSYQIRTFDIKNQKYRYSELIKEYCGEFVSSSFDGNDTFFIDLVNENGDKSQVYLDGAEVSFYGVKWLDSRYRVSGYELGDNVRREFQKRYREDTKDRNIISYTSKGIKMFEDLEPVSYPRFFDEDGNKYTGVLFMSMFNKDISNFDDILVLDPTNNDMDRYFGYLGIDFSNISLSKLTDSDFISGRDVKKMGLINVRTKNYDKNYSEIIKKHVYGFLDRRADIKKR